MKRMVFLLAVLGTLLSGCGAPAPGGGASSAPQEGSSVQEELPNTEGENSVPLEEEPEPEPPSRQDSIPFTGDQLYAAAYLGFEEMEDLSYYTQRYLDSGDLLLLLIVLLLLWEGDDLELVIALGLVLILGLGDEEMEP